MPNLTITNFRTIANKFVNAIVTGLAIGTTAVTIYGGSMLVDNMYTDYKFNKNYKIVDKAISSKDYDLALKLLDDLSKKYLLRSTDAIMLKSTIEKEQTTKKLAQERLQQEKERKEKERLNKQTQQFEEGTFVSSFGHPRREESDTEFTKRQLKGIEEKVQEQSPLYVPYMNPYAKESKHYATIKSSKDLERIESAKLYLDFYPNGEHKKQVLETLITDEFDLLNNSIKEKKDFIYVENTLNDLTVILKKYSNEPVSIKKPIKIKELVKNANKYFSEESDKGYKIGVGDRVKITSSNGQNSGFSSTYFEERNKIFEKGSIGDVIDVSKNSVFVKFSEKSLYWANKWNSFKKYSKDGDVAEYKVDELIVINDAGEVITPIGISKRDNFLYNLKQLEEIFYKYYQPK